MNLAQASLFAVARTIVAMEQGYVTAAFFRHRMYERYRQWEEQEQLGRMLDEGEYLLLESTRPLSARLQWCIDLIAHPCMCLIFSSARFLVNANERAVCGFAGQAAPDDSDSENDSESSPTQSRRNLDQESMSSGGMAIPDADEPPPKEKQREPREPKEPREKEPNFGESAFFYTLLLF